MCTLTDNAIQILEDRYLLRDEKGKLIETSETLFRRVAHFVACCETLDKSFWETKFYEVLTNLEFLPNSPTLMNAGCENGQLSACFVLPIEDSLESIFTTLKHAALIHQSGGGTGFNFSKLRPKDDRVSSNSGSSSGPVAFMKVYDAATEYVKQGGKRRGANMGILNVDHPDIEAFITSKSDKKAIANFNISVGVTDSFMQAVVSDSQWQLTNPRTHRVEKMVRANNLWSLIVHEAWNTGDPGLVFLDTINEYSPTAKPHKIECTNPCGEVPLLEYESCNLGSINLSKCIGIRNEKPELNWEKLKTIVKIGIRFLDNIITLNYYLVPEIKTVTLKNRKIGLGVMGWAELLIMLEIPYASEQAIRLAEKLMRFIKHESYTTSQQLAKERGAFPGWNNSIHYPNHQLRNATCNSIAPTGTISVIANTSYSIEPLFALAYKRVGILENQTQIEINGMFKSKMKALNLWSTKLEAAVLETGSIAHIASIPDHVKTLFKTSLDIPWLYHLKHQKAFQDHTDNAVSKTINLPETASEEDISKIFMTAWKYKLKGITIYRYGSKDHQVLQKCGIETNTNCD